MHFATIAPLAHTVLHPTFLLPPPPQAPADNQLA